jgi:hypothetical protein
MGRPFPTSTFKAASVGVATDAFLTAACLALLCVRLRRFGNQRRCSSGSTRKKSAPAYRARLHRTFLGSRHNPSFS